MKILVMKKTFNVILFISIQQTENLIFIIAEKC